MSNSVLVIVNKVLRKLRETKITSITDQEYPELITDLLTETLTEVEQAWDWDVMFSDISVATVAAQSQYSVTGAEGDSKVRSIYNQTKDYHLTQDNSRVINGLRDTNPTTGDPQWWRHSGVDSNGVITVDVYPIPDEVDTMLVDTKTYTGDLVYTSPSTNLLDTPLTPLVLGTYAKAVAERGEDDGESFNKADAKYRASLASSIQIENEKQLARNALWTND